MSEHDFQSEVLERMGRLEEQSKTGTGYRKET